MVFENTLQGKNIAIAGATKGIGRATALLLHELGANIVIGARSTAELKDLTSSLSSDRVIGIPLDVTDERSVENFYHMSVLNLQNVGALVNCAGYGNFTSFLDLETEDFDRMLNVNLRGSFLTSKYFAKHMVENKQGQIVNVNSIAGVTALQGCSGYSASKFGLLGLTRVMQQELRAKGVYVTSILPGSVDTPFWDSMEQHPDRAKMIPVETIARHIAFILNQPEGAVVDEVTVMPPLGIL
jgi:3-oxoacyl-[acyl-carrier protein] reductase